jgi:hypothetical protein
MAAKVGDELFEVHVRSSNHETPDSDRGQNCTNARRATLQLLTVQHRPDNGDRCREMVVSLFEI